MRDNVQQREGHWYEMLNKMDEFMSSKSEGHWYETLNIPRIVAVFEQEEAGQKDETASS